MYVVPQLLSISVGLLPRSHFSSTNLPEISAHEGVFQFEVSEQYDDNSTGTRVHSIFDLLRPMQSPLQLFRKKLDRK